MSGDGAGVPWHATDAGPIAVAVDGTPSGQDAVAWSIEEARRRDAGVWIPPGTTTERILAETAGASIIVIGSGSLLRMSDLAGGSTAMEVAARADVPVVVVRPDLPQGEAGPSAGGVVAGTDTTEGSRAAVGFAHEVARARGCGVTVLHAVEREEDRSAAEAELAAAYPRARTVVAVGMASHALIEESAGALLLVVGSRGRGGLAGMLLGSVSQAVVHRARCPVAVVRALAA